MSSRFHFQELTPDHILDAIEDAGFYPASGLLPLNSYENRVYQFLDDNGSRYVVKFYRPERWSKAQIQEEHDFVAELEEHEIPAITPLKIRAETVLDFGGYYFTVFPSVGGRALEADQLDQLEELGRHLGRLHLVGASRPFQHRPPLVNRQLIAEYADTVLRCELIPTALKQALYAILTPLTERLQAIAWEEHQWLRLHGDCHIGNLLWNSAGLHLVDFDDCRQGPAIQDLWMMLSGDRMQQQLQLETLLSGYEEFADFRASELQLVEPLRTFRIIQYMAWLVKRWDDPAFPHNFGWFAEEKYWEQQVLALKEQLAALDEPPLRLQPDFN